MRGSAEARVRIVARRRGVIIIIVRRAGARARSLLSQACARSSAFARGGTLSTTSDTWHVSCFSQDRAPRWAYLRDANEHVVDVRARSRRIEAACFPWDVNLDLVVTVLPVRHDDLDRPGAEVLEELASGLDVASCMTLRALPATVTDSFFWMPSAEELRLDLRRTRQRHASSNAIGSQAQPQTARVLIVLASPRRRGSQQQQTSAAAPPDRGVSAAPPPRCSPPTTACEREDARAEGIACRDGTPVARAAAPRPAWSRRRSFAGEYYYGRPFISLGFVGRSPATPTSVASCRTSAACVAAASLFS